jgi:ABC-type uncharacterized transport system ATPase subunit
MVTDGLSCWVYATGLSTDNCRWKSSEPDLLGGLIVIVYDIQNLVKSYPGQAQPANKNITLQIYQGEIFGILGDNGAGKSTLVRQMVNLLSSDSGAIAPMLSIMTNT